MCNAGLNITFTLSKKDLSPVYTIVDGNDNVYIPLNELTLLKICKLMERGETIQMIEVNTNDSRKFVSVNSVMNDPEEDLDFQIKIIERMQSVLKRVKNTKKRMSLKFDCDKMVI